MKRPTLLLTLACCVLAAPVAHAEAKLGLESLGATVGMVSPENLGSTFGLGAFANLGTIVPDLGLETRVDFWSKSESSFGFETSVSDITLGARVKYFFTLEGTPIQPYAGGGLGIHFLHSEVTVPPFFGAPPMTASGSDTRIGLDLGGGFTAPVSPRSDLVGEAWYGVVSDFSQLALRVGLSYKLGS
jgi:opacity protein-like surface antigen